MLLIARRTALAAALLLVMPLTVWLSGWLWQLWTAGCHVEKPVVGDGNGDPAVKLSLMSCFAAGSSGVCAFGCARR